MNVAAVVRLLGTFALATKLLGSSMGSAQEPQIPPGYTAKEWQTIKASQLKQAADGQKVSRDSPTTPKNPTALEGLCNQPPFNGDRTIWNSFRTPRWKRALEATLGTGDTSNDLFDMTNDSCIPKSYDVYVPNETEVKLRIWQDPAATCTAIESYTDDPSKDYGSVFTSALPAASLGGILFTQDLVIPKKAGLPPPPLIPNIKSIVLPASGVKNTAATVTISCHADDEDTDVGIQQKLTVHYVSIDLFSGSTGAIVSTLGKKIYGVNTTDTGSKNPDGTPTTQSTIGVTSSSNAQFVPIGLVNVNWAGNEKNNLNLQFGVGINPNGSSTQVEYFLSPLAFASHHIYIAPGVHIARSERVNGGFAVGEVVPSGFTVPTVWQTTYKFGVTFSVKPYSK